MVASVNTSYFHNSHPKDVPPDVLFLDDENTIMLLYCLEVFELLWSLEFWGLKANKANFEEKIQQYPKLCKNDSIPNSCG
jgi:hypothetical protein